MANELSKEQLHRLARLGARARLAELETERRAILRAFPDLGAAARAAVGAESLALPSGDGAPAVSVKKPRRRKMTDAQRKAMSERMRQRWAERKKAQA